MICILGERRRLRSRLFPVSSRSLPDQLKDRKLDILGTTIDLSESCSVPRRSTEQVCPYLPLLLAAVTTASMNNDNKICLMECELTEEVLMNEEQTRSEFNLFTIHIRRDESVQCNLQSTACFKFSYGHSANDRDCDELLHVIRKL
jgi:hypothetical protein